MTAKDPYAEAVEYIDAAEQAHSPETETYRLRRAQVLATLAQSAPKDETETSRAAMASRVLDTVGGSIGKADSKAACITSLDTAVLAGVLALQPSGLGTAARIVLGVGTALIAVAALFAVAVVLPILRSRHAGKRSAGDVLYFGAVRTHTGRELAARLADESTAEALCAQAVVLSRLSWMKHRLLQVAMLATLAGGLLIAGTLLIAGGAR